MYQEIAIWPDGTWCETDKLEEYTEFAGDDYAVTHRWSYDERTVGEFVEDYMENTMFKPIPEDIPF